MALRIIWSPHAVRDIDEIAAYIARDSERYARIVADKLFGAGNRLADFPLLGHRLPDLKDDRYRQLVVYSYRLIYRVETDAVRIIGIVHGARLLPPEMTSRD